MHSLQTQKYKYVDKIKATYSLLSLNKSELTEIPFKRSSKCSKYENYVDYSHADSHKYPHIPKRKHRHNKTHNSATDQRRDVNSRFDKHNIQCPISPYNDNIACIAHPCVAPNLKTHPTHTDFISCWVALHTLHYTRMHRQ